jgi:hypothetical protein
MLVSSWQYYFSQVWFAPSPLRPPFCVAIALSTATLGCLCQLRRNMFSVQEIPCLQSFCALTGAVFYGTIISLMWLDAKYVLFPPAPPQAIVLPRKKHSGVAGICCPICLVDFERDEALSCGERCGHCFHDSCIQEWIAHIQRRPNQRVTCPFCRQELQCQRQPKKSKTDPKQEQQRSGTDITSTSTSTHYSFGNLVNVIRGTLSP